MVLLVLNLNDEQSPHDGPLPNTAPDNTEQQTVEKSYDQNVTKQGLDSKVSWFVCICSSLASLINVGTCYVYGILFPSILREFQAGKARTALVGSFSIAFLTLLCPISSKLINRFGSRIVIACGGVTCALGLLGSSFAPRLYVLYFSYGLVLGCGSCMVYMAAFLVVPLYFDKHRNVATAIASVGPGAGLLVMSPVTQTLLEHFDWRKTLLILAGINLISSFLGFGISRKNFSRAHGEPSAEPANKKKCCSAVTEALNFSLLKSPMFIMLATMNMLVYMAHFMPIVHLIKYAEDIGIPSHSSSWMYFITGVVSFISRILVGKLCDSNRVSFFHIFQSGVMLMALADFLIPLASQLRYLYAYAVIQGICEALYVTSVCCLVLILYPKQGLGWLFFFSGVPIFIAPPFAGLIADLCASYKPAFFTAGCFLVLGSLVPFIRPFITQPERADKTGRKMNIPEFEELLTTGIEKLKETLV